MKHYGLLLHGLREQTFVIHRVILLNTEEKLWEKAVSAYPIEQILEELPVSVHRKTDQKE